MNYPLQMSFKVLALARQISVTDATGHLIFYVKQKAFKLKEAVTVFADAGQTQPVYSINANKVLDFSARYTFTDSSGRPLGSVRRQGMKSLWKAHYDVLDGENAVMTIKEENAWTKVLDSLIGEIPVLGDVHRLSLSPGLSRLPSGRDGRHASGKAARFLRG